MTEERTTPDGRRWVVMDEHGATWSAATEKAETFRRRLAGWMGRSVVGPGEGLWLEPCRCVHTCFMRFPLDIVFISGGDRVLRVVRSVRPWRVVWGGWRVRSALEVPAGSLPGHAAVGARLIKARHPSTAQC